MNKILLSLAVIGFVVAGVAGATIAYFNSSATITASTFTSGTMALKIDGNAAPEGYSWYDGFADPYSPISNLYPGYPNKGEHNWQVLDIKNVGAVDGYTTIQLNRTSAWSELVDNLVFTISYDSGNVGAWVPVTSGTLAQFAGNTYTLGGFTGASNTLGGLSGRMASVKIAWSVPTSAGNNIQGKSVTIDTVFGLEQTP